MAGRKLSIAGGMAPLWRPPARDADGWRWGADRERTRMTASTNHRQKEEMASAWKKKKKKTVSAATTRLSGGRFSVSTPIDWFVITILFLRCASAATS